MTNALPFGIYLAPASIFQQAVRTRISHQVWCYIQLLQRVSNQSYAIYVAASYTDLLYIHRGHADENTENRVIVSTITRQDFHQHCRLIAAPTCERPLYAAPNCVLQDKCSSDNIALQLVASSAWLCYFRVLQIYADGFVQIRVAALPHRTDEVDRSYITTLSRDEFAQALPLEHDDLALSTCDLREKVEKHAQAISGQEVERIRPVVPLDEEDRSTPLPALAYPPEVLNSARFVDGPLRAECRERERIDEKQFSVVKGLQTWPLDTIFVPQKTARHIVKAMQHLTDMPAFRILKQKMWLQATLNTLRDLRDHVVEADLQDALQAQDCFIRQVLVNWIYRTEMRLVEAEPLRRHGQLHGYHIHIEMPIGVL